MFAGSNIAAAVPVFVVSAASSVVARVLGNSGPLVGPDSEPASIVYYGWHTSPEELLCNNCLCLLASRCGTRSAARLYSRVTKRMPMPEKPSRDGQSVERSGRGDAAGDRPVRGTEGTGDDGESSASTDESSDIDGSVQRRLREAYLNDEAGVLVVTDVRSAGSEVHVAFQPPHGGSTHVERFPAPRDGSLAESAAFLDFLETAGVSPLDVDELVGTRVPATYDADEGWQIDRGYAEDRSADASRSLRSAGAALRSRSGAWLWQYRYWLLATLLVGGEILFVVVIILLYT